MSEKNGHKSNTRILIPLGLI